MDKIRWGIFGTGAMAQRFKEDIVLSETGVLVAVASRNIDNAASFAPDVIAFESFEALARSSDIDAIYIAAPTVAHHRLCLLAISCGKAVLCEKPIALTSQQAEEIADAAETAGVFCMEALWSCFLPGVRAIKELINDNKLGAPLHANASLGFSWNEAEGDPITDQSVGGGAALDLGVYCVGLLGHLLGPPRLVEHQTLISESGNVRALSALLTHPIADGVSTTIACRHDTVLPNRLEISFTNGRIEIAPIFIEVRQAWSWQVSSRSYQREQPPSSLTNWIRKRSAFPAMRRVAKIAMRSGASSIDCGYSGTGFQFQIDEVGHCLDKGKSTSEILPIRDSLWNLKVIEQLSAGEIHLKN